MHRCLVTPDRWPNGNAPVRLAPDVRHHLVHVLRAQAGDRVLLFDGAGREAEAEITGMDADGPCLRIVAARQCRPQPLQLLLVQAVPKGKRMDLLLEKATEIGATDILPVLSARTVVRLERAERGERRERWQRIVNGAARQCGAPWIPRVHEAVDFADALDAAAGWDCVLLAALTGESLHIRDAAEAAWRSGRRRIALMIGPEGDWTPAEIRDATGRGAQPVTLGDRVLRSETAAIFGVSVIVASCR
jgi:16S rRNA (uracil1498-N3)-methyltransferase